MNEQMPDNPEATATRQEEVAERPRRTLDKKQQARRARARSRIELLRHVRHRPPVSVPPGISEKGLLYLLHNCLPYHTGGYAIRAHGLLKGYKEAGWDVLAQARPGYPGDRVRIDAPVSDSQVVDGIDYRFLPDRLSIDIADQAAYVEQYAESVLDSIDTSRVGVVQAASFFQSGLAGRLIADRLGVPLVYEMRGLEWFTNGSRDPSWQRSMHGIIGREMELEAARCADHVFAITGALRAWLIAHGIPAEKVSVLPNGCTVEDTIVDVSARKRLERELDLKDTFVVGYVGSVVYYEGLDVIIRAIDEAREVSCLDIRFLLVGDGPDFAAVRHFAGTTGAERFVNFVGRVPHHEVGAYYSLIDAFVMARTDLEICHVISPLKPLEAMMKGKLLITSDVEAIAEMAQASDGGALLFRAGDASALARRIIEAAQDPQRMSAMAKRGHDWAIDKRNWSALAREALDTLQARFAR